MSAPEPDRRYSATLEPAPCGTHHWLRIHPVPAAVLGDPWVWCAAVEDRGRGVAYLMLVTESPPSSCWQGVLRAAGFTSVAWSRVKDGVRHEVGPIPLRDRG